METFIDPSEFLQKLDWNPARFSDNSIAPNKYQASLHSFNGEYCSFVAESKDDFFEIYCMIPDPEAWSAGWFFFMETEPVNFSSDELLIKKIIGC
jgi:hypothetical protein